MTKLSNAKVFETCLLNMKLLMVYSISMFFTILVSVKITRCNIYKYDVIVSMALWRNSTNHKCTYTYCGIDTMPSTIGAILFHRYNASDIIVPRYLCNTFSSIQCLWHYIVGAILFHRYNACNAILSMQYYFINKMPVT